MSEPATLSIVEAPGGGAVVLHGPREDVEQATEWIEQLDAMSTPGRIIKVYEIVHADIGKLADLILNVVDTPPKQSPKQRSRPRKGAEPASRKMNSPSARPGPVRTSISRPIWSPTR